VFGSTPLPGFPADPVVKEGAQRLSRNLRSDGRAMSAACGSARVGRRQADNAGTAGFGSTPLPGFPADHPKFAQKYFTEVSTSRSKQGF
jgi:hypothetical protein